MAKLSTMFFILIAIQACLLLYNVPCHSFAVDGVTCLDNVGNNSLWDFITNLDNWNSLEFILAWFGIAGGIGLVGITAGSVFGFKTDFIILATAIPGFISIGIVFSQLANVVRDQLMSWFMSAGVTTCTAASCPAATFFVAITIAPIAFYFVWTILEWWRGKDY